VRQSDQDQVTIVTAGITISEAIQAHDQLEREGINVRVIDAYSVKPIDAETITRSVRETGGRLITVEDHWPEGGLGDAVLDVFAGRGQTLPTFLKLAVGSMPGSGKPAELLHAAGIDADHIVTAVKEILNSGKS
jgi:transketolase